jgi:hypothetical protein
MEVNKRGESMFPFRQSNSPKKQKKNKQNVVSFICQEKYDEVRKLVPLLKKSDENVLSGIDEAIQELLSKEEFHGHLFSFYKHLLATASPVLFQLYYETLLFNPDLYHFLQHKYEYSSENEFDYFLLSTAEDFEDKEAQNYALGILATLKDSFFANEELKKAFEEKNDTEK